MADPETSEMPSSEPVRPVSRDTIIDGETLTLHTHEADAFAKAARWTLDPVPMYVAGDPANGDGNFDVEWALDVRLLADGRLVALKSLNGNVVYVFDSRGRGQHRWGRTGQGPGDLMRPAGLLHGLGDTLLIPDDANARLNVLLPDRGIVSSRSVPQFRQNPGPINDVLATTADGALVVSVVDVRQLMRREPGEGDSAPRQPILIRRLGLDGTAQDLVTIAGTEQTMQEQRYGGVSRQRPTHLMFGRAAHAAFLADQLVTSEEDGYTLDWRDERGRIRARVRVPVPRRPVTEAMREQIIARNLERFSGASSERMVDPGESRRLVLAMPFADSLGWFSAWHATDDGVLWVVDPIAPTDSGWTASAWAPDGLLLARLHAMGSGTPLHFTRTHVVVRTRDEDGVVTLEVRRIVGATP